MSGDQQAQSQNIQSQFETFSRLYQALTSLVTSLPFSEKHKSFMVLNFDQGFLWAKEAFQFALSAQVATASLAVPASVDADVASTDVASQETSAA